MIGAAEVALAAPATSGEDEVKCSLRAGGGGEAPESTKGGGFDPLGGKYSFARGVIAMEIRDPKRRLRRVRGRERRKAKDF